MLHNQLKIVTLDSNISVSEQSCF